MLVSENEMIVNGSTVAFVYTNPSGLIIFCTRDGKLRPLFSSYFRSKANATCRTIYQSSPQEQNPQVINIAITRSTKNIAIINLGNDRYGVFFKTFLAYK